MDTFITWAIGLFVLGIGIVMLLGFIALVFDDPGEESKPVRQTKRGLGKTLVAGILLGMWLDDDK